MEAEPSSPRGLTIHLFHASRLIANLRTTDAEPAKTYTVDGARWSVVDAAGPHVDTSGLVAWDVQVEPA